MVGYYLCVDIFGIVVDVEEFVVGYFIFELGFYVNGEKKNI